MNLVRVEAVRAVSDSAYVLRFARKQLYFEPGQYLTIGLPDSISTREYSIYSGAEQPYLEVLVKQVEGGTVSHQLRRQQPGAELQCDGPFGYFVLDQEARQQPLLLVATGTGIAPFHAFVSSYQGLNYQLLHGVRSAAECYDRASYAASRYQPCLSREPAAGAFHGRVTDYLRAHPVAAETRCYLCGNSEMIFEAFDILKGYGVPSERLFAEVYF